tara:strand:+ start:186 stop:536 length:351 start_codon:yes stop_codon:yes gene_type:complete
MGKLILAIMMFLNIGFGTHIEKVFKHENARYVEKHIGQTMVVEVSGQTMVLNHNQAILWFQYISEDMAIISVKAKKIRRSKVYTHSLLFEFISNGERQTLRMYLEMHKGHIVRVSV